MAGQQTAKEQVAKNRLWIAWEGDTSIRSRVLAAELGADYQAFTTFSESRSLSWLRYPIACLQTTTTLLRNRPKTLVVQNPSVLLAFWAALLMPFLRYHLIIDLHTPFNKLTGTTKLVVDFLHRFGLRRCSAVIVTNEGYKATVSQVTTRPIFVLPDKVPRLDAPLRPAQLRGLNNVLYVCTYAQDEPWQAVVAAALQLPPETVVYISGRGPLKMGEVPPNVIPTGYLAREDYESLLRSVDAVMVLTTAEDNLVCGGYEAVSAGKPLILSNTTALRSLFGAGALFTDNSDSAIANAIRLTFQQLGEQRDKMQALRVGMETDWRRQWGALQLQLERMET